MVNEKIIKELVDEAVYDEVGLWFVVSRVQEEYELHNNHEIRTIVLEYVREMLKSGKIVAAYYTSKGTGFDVWGMSHEDIVSRIDREWRELGRIPDMGEIVVFLGSDSPYIR